MNALAKHLAKNVNIVANTHVQQLQPCQGWLLEDTHGKTLGTFDWVISTAPAAQSAQLLPKEFAHFNALNTSTMLACFSLMLGFNEPLPLEFDSALVKGSDISWISVNSSKPKRPPGFTLLVHSTNCWAEQHFDQDRAKTQAHLCAITSDLIGHDVSQASHIGLHGWRYANCPKQPKCEPLVDSNLKLAACGDWCIQGRVEAAFISAKRTAEVIKQSIVGEQTHV